MRESLVTVCREKKVSSIDDRRCGGTIRMINEKATSCPLDLLFRRPAGKRGGRALGEMRDERGRRG